MIFIFIGISIFFTIIIKPQYLNIDIESYKEYEKFNNNNIEKFDNQIEPKINITTEINNCIEGIDKIWNNNKNMFNGLKTEDDYRKKKRELGSIIENYVLSNYDESVYNNKDFQKTTFNFQEILEKRIENIKNNIPEPPTENIINTNTVINNSINAFNNNTLTDYKSGVNFQKVLNYKGMPDKYDIHNNEPLLTYMCVKTQLTSTENMYDLQNMISTLSSSFYISVIDTYILNTTDIINKISSDFDDVIRKSGEIKLECPIYALIYQSPYLRYNNNEVTARYDVVNNLQSSYEHIADNSANTPNIGMRPLYAKIIMLYPLYIDYNGAGKIIKLTDNSGLSTFQSYFNDSIMSRDKLCFLKCNQTNKLACGCLNRSTNTDTDTSDDKYYKSTCVDNNNIPTNYGMMYSINFNYASFVSKIYMKETI